MLVRDIEPELVPLCKAYDIGILPYYPLANGFLTGKYRRGQPPPDGTRLAGDDRGMLTDANFEVLERLELFAGDREHTVLELAFAWLLTNPAISSVIAGATRAEQVVANAKTTGWHLTAAEMAEVDELLAG
jgi:aryl-alcohol dehydrogenase-like predicted oxidoreductase